VSSTAAEVTIIGAGVVGCAAAAVLAEAGARVQVYERDEVAGAASGRNSGVVQHPFDPVLADLHVETVGLYRELDGLALPVDPAGVLMLARDPAQLAGVAAGIGREAPALRPTLLEPAEVRQLEPAEHGCQSTPADAARTAPPGITRQRRCPGRRGVSPASLTATAAAHEPCARARRQEAAQTALCAAATCPARQRGSVESRESGSSCG